MKGKYERKDDRKPHAKPAGLGQSYDAAFRGFVNLNLSAADKADYEGWVATNGFWDVLAAQTADGVQVSVKWDAKQGCFLGSARQQRAASPNAGLVATARGATAEKALTRIVYVLLLLSTQERWEATQPIADADRW